MIFFTDFPVRFNQLRSTHNLSSGQLADILQFKSQVSISNMEKGKALPSVEVLEKIGDLFGVSLDWIMGRSDEFYEDKVISKLEEHFLRKSKTIDDVSLGYFRLEVGLPLLHVPNSPYNDAKKRKLYSLAVRANIIFAMQIFCHTSIKFFELDPAAFDTMNMGTVNRILVPKLQKEKNGKGLWNLCTRCSLFFDECIKCEVHPPKFKSTNEILPLFDLSSVDGNISSV